MTQLLIDNTGHVYYDEDPKFIAGFDEFRRCYQQYQQLRQSGKKVDAQNLGKTLQQWLEDLEKNPATKDWPDKVKQMIKDGAHIMTPEEAQRVLDENQGSTDSQPPLKVVEPPPEQVSQSNPKKTVEFPATAKGDRKLTAGELATQFKECLSNDLGLEINIIGKPFEGYSIQGFDFVPVRGPEGLVINPKTFLSDQLITKLIIYGGFPEDCPIRVKAKSGCFRLEVDIPARYRKKILFRDYVKPRPWDISYASEDFKIPCGVDQYGQLLYLNFSERPHLLICGETGYGKDSQMFNLVRAIATLNHPSYAQVVVVDPPGLEIARWHNSPWFWRNGEVVREVKQFIALQETILREIKRRNKIFEEAGNCLSIASYNKKAIANNWDIMPRLLVFNSELGMFKVPGKQHRVYAQDKREEIGKTARKFGIHIIESSQRPKSEISPTVIGYCGHRMAFYLNQSDSAAVLEGNKEANQLHSPGDFLYFRSDGTTWGHSLYTPEEEMDQVIAQATDLTLSSRLNLSNRVGTLFTDIDPEQVDTSQAA